MLHSDSVLRFSLIFLAIVSLMFFASVTTQGQTASHTREPQCPLKDELAVIGSISWQWCQRRISNLQFIASPLLEA